LFSSEKREARGSSSGLGCDASKWACQVIHPWSDHMPIQLELEVPSLQLKCPNKPLSLPSKLVWKDENKIDYQNRLTMFANTIVDFKGSTDDQIFMLDYIIKKAAKYNPKPVKIVNSKMKWFDKECELDRRNSFEMLNRFRKSNNVQDKVTYLQLNRLFKHKCYEKRKSIQ